jgi:hypothetical protein
MEEPQGDIPPSHRPFQATGGRKPRSLPLAPLSPFSPSSSLEAAAEQVCAASMKGWRGSRAARPFAREQGGVCLVGMAPARFPRAAMIHEAARDGGGGHLRLSMILLGPSMALGLSGALIWWPVATVGAVGQGIWMPGRWPRAWWATLF